MPRRQNESKPEDALIAERRLQALDLRKTGASFRAIGQQLGISHEQARNDIEHALKQLSDKQDKKTEEYRQLELERLDRLLLGVWSQAIKGDVGSVNAALKISDRRSKLLGLDAPQQISVETWEDEYVRAIKAGEVDYQSVMEVLKNESLAEKLFRLARINVAPTGESENQET